jgi:hypothetical protein
VPLRVSERLRLMDAALFAHAPPRLAPVIAGDAA